MFILIAGTLREKLPFELDQERKVEEPFNVKEWLQKNDEEMKNKGCKMVFGDGYQFQVHL